MSPHNEATVRLALPPGVTEAEVLEVLQKALKSPLSDGDKADAEFDAAEARARLTGIFERMLPTHAKLIGYYDQDIKRSRGKHKQALIAERQHEINKAEWLVRTHFNTYYEMQFLNGKRLAGSDKRLSSNEREIIRRLANNEAQYAIRALLDAQTGEYTNPLDWRGGLYGNALDEAKWLGWLYGDLSNSRFVAWRLDEAESCFPAGTAITTPGGTTPIEALKIGDLVLTLNGYKRVTQVFKRNYQGKLLHIAAGGRDVHCTPNHPFLTQRGWVEAADLCAGDNAVLLEDGSEPVYSEITFPDAHNGVSASREVGVLCDRVNVYNIEVEDVHHYVANGMVVHNCIDCLWLAGRLDILEARIYDAVAKRQEKTPGAGLTPAESLLLTKIAEKTPTQGGRWGIGVYRAQELAKMGVVPQSGELVCTTNCKCHLEDAERPAGKTKQKEATAWESILPKTPTMLLRETEPERNEQLARLAEKWEHEHLPRRGHEVLKP